MTNPQVLLEPRGATPQELRLSVRTLLLQVPHVEVVEPTDTQFVDLPRCFGSRVSRAQHLRPGVPILVTSGRVCWAAGSVRRVVAELAVPGRFLTRVLVPGVPEGEGQIACWSPTWLAGFSGSVTGLAGADLTFDRDHLPRESPQARSWVRADVIGLAPAVEVQGDVKLWSWRTGLALTGRELVTSFRAPLGAARRRLRRRRQRSHAESTTHRVS